MKHNYRFGRFGMALLVLASPVVLPVYALWHGIMQCGEVMRWEMGKLPGAIRYIFTGK